MDLKNYIATNEKGLSMAGLNFPENADFKPAKDGKTNVASFEFILWILSQCESLSEARLIQSDNREALFGYKKKEVNNLF